MRGEYPLARQRLEGAIDAARAKGLLGADVMGRGFSFDIEVFRGAGAYICGEETAIFNSIEGFRGEPRSKPPFPVEVGLFGRPTVVNNVETLANVLPIVQFGAAAYRRVGTAASPGTKLFCLSGPLQRPGTYEVPFGTSLRELLELAGGLTEGRSLDAVQAVLLGGAAGSFVGPDRLDLPLTFEDTRAAGSTVGSGVVIVFDDRADLVDTVGRIAAFFRDESCGQCVPCRVGTVRQEEAIVRLTERRRGAAVPSSTDDDVRLLRDVGRAMRDASICGLGQTAWNAVESALDRLDVFGAGGDTAGRLLDDDTTGAAPHRLVQVTIDGVAHTAAEGDTVLDVCRAAGLDTPTLCYGDTLTPRNACRVCVVETGGQPHAGAGLLAPGGGRPGGAHRQRAGAAQPSSGARAARLVGRSVADRGRGGLERALRRRPVTLRAGGRPGAGRRPGSGGDR
ncbi:MAG: NADH-ubiquinone oxidoreductase-F iron-sulfur binding region domain-containing protein [Acidimicrobiales bacterium]